MNIESKGLGLIKDNPDERDRVFSAPITIEPLQSVYVAHNRKFPPAYDQGSLGSCTANAIGFLVHYNLLNGLYQTPTPVYRPSRLFNYYFAREMLGTVGSDSGARLRDAIKVINVQGAPSEDVWTYQIPKFTTKPDERALRYGQKLQSVAYERVDNTRKDLMVAALRAGFPIAFGIEIYEGFYTESAYRYGIIPFPDISKQMAVGGHAMVIVGYRAEDDTFIVRNSWGTNWGQGGYCRMPSDYITNPYFAWDFWILKMLE